jgi:hypothetical protein
MTMQHCASNHRKTCPSATLSKQVPGWARVCAVEWPATNWPTHGHPDLSLELKVSRLGPPFIIRHVQKKFWFRPCFQKPELQRRSRPSYQSLSRSSNLSRQTETHHSCANTRDDLMPTLRQLYYSPTTNDDLMPTLRQLYYSLTTNDDLMPTLRQLYYSPTTNTGVMLLNMTKCKLPDKFCILINVTL